MPFIVQFSFESRERLEELVVLLGIFLEGLLRPEIRLVWVASTVWASLSTSVDFSASEAL